MNARTTNALPKTTRLAVITGPKRIEIQTRPLPELQAGQLLVAVTANGICGSDVEVYLGLAPQKLPMDVGHEFGGVVQAVGPGVTAFRPGDRVAAWVPAGCGLADYAVVEARYCVPVPDAVKHPEMAEPLACAVNSVHRASTEAGDVVVIIGTGYMALLIQQLIKSRRPSKVIFAARKQSQLNLAKAAGATHTVMVTEDTAAVAAAIRKAAGGDGADIVYEAVGVPATLDLAARVLRVEGKLAIVGYHQGGAHPVDVGRWADRELTILNCHFRNTETIMRGMKRAVELLAAGAIIPPPVVRFTFDRLDAAFERAVQRPDGFVKAVIDL